LDADDIANIVEKRRLNWLGREETSFVVTRAYKEEFQGKRKRKRGRPKKSWSSQIRQDVTN